MSSIQGSSTPTSPTSPTSPNTPLIAPQAASQPSHTTEALVNAFASFTIGPSATAVAAVTQDSAGLNASMPSVTIGSTDSSVADIADVASNTIGSQHMLNEQTRAEKNAAKKQKRKKKEQAEKTYCTNAKKVMVSGFKEGSEFTPVFKAIIGRIPNHFSVFNKTVYMNTFLGVLISSNFHDPIAKKSEIIKRTNKDWIPPIFLEYLESAIEKIHSTGNQYRYPPEFMYEAFLQNVKGYRQYFKQEQLTLISNAMKFIQLSRGLRPEEFRPSYFKLNEEEASGKLVETFNKCNFLFFIDHIDAIFSEDSLQVNGKEIHKIVKREVNGLVCELMKDLRACPFPIAHSSLLRKTLNQLNQIRTAAILLHANGASTLHIKNIQEQKILLVYVAEYLLFQMSDVIDNACYNGSRNRLLQESLSLFETVTQNGLFSMDNFLTIALEDFLNKFKPSPNYPMIDLFTFFDAVTTRRLGGYGQCLNEELIKTTDILKFLVDEGPENISGKSQQIKKFTLLLHFALIFDLEVLNTRSLEIEYLCQLLTGSFGLDHKEEEPEDEDEKEFGPSVSSDSVHAERFQMMAEEERRKEKFRVYAQALNQMLQGANPQ